MHRYIGIVFALSALAVGCGSGGNDAPEDTSQPATTTCDKETRDEPYTAGITKKGTNDVSVTIVSSDPAPPALYANDWVLEIKDPSGQPLSGATVQVSPFMPDHNHGTYPPAEVTELGDGRYDANPVYFTMPAYWEITVKVTTDALMDTVKFKLCIQ
jgi:hypothetical protein